MAVLIKLTFGRWKQEIVIVRGSGQAGSSAVSHSEGLQKMCKSLSLLWRLPANIPYITAAKGVDWWGHRIVLSVLFGLRWFSSSFLYYFFFLFLVSMRELCSLSEYRYVTRIKYILEYLNLECRYKAVLSLGGLIKCSGRPFLCFFAEAAAWKD